MKTKLMIEVVSEVAMKIKAYAKTSKVFVSKIAEEYFNQLIEQIKMNEAF